MAFSETSRVTNFRTAGPREMMRSATRFLSSKRDVSRLVRSQIASRRVFEPGEGVRVGEAADAIERVIINGIRLSKDPNTTQD